MGNAEQGPGAIIALPQGGGAVRGIGETFRPDLQTGTGNLTVPFAVPPGRRGLEPKLELACSSGNGNGPFGQGWAFGVPGVRPSDVGRGTGLRRRGGHLPPLRQ